MKLPRRKFLHLAAGATALPAVSRTAWAQAYPSRPVRIIVGFPAGGGADIVARLIGQWLSERLGQQFIIENRTGAGTNIATEAVIRAAPDGYTLLMASAANAIKATSGSGSPPHVGGELFQMMTGLKMVQVAYRGDAPAIADLIGGQVHVYF